MQTAPTLSVFLEAGIYSAQSTPLYSRSGKLLGMISTHWDFPHNPPQRHLGLLDILAGQAADLIERTQTEEALKESEARLRALTSQLETMVTERTKELQHSLNYGQLPEIQGVQVMIYQLFYHLIKPSPGCIQKAGTAGPAWVFPCARISSSGTAARSGPAEQRCWRLVHDPTARKTALKARPAARGMQYATLTETSVKCPLQKTTKTKPPPSSAR